MAKISDLPAATAVATTDTVVVVQAGVTKKGTASLLPVNPHTHAQADVTGLSTALSAKQATLTVPGDVPGLMSALATKQAILTAPADVPGLATALAAKQATLTAPADVPGLTSALAAKAAQTAVDANTTALAGKQATLTGAGDVPGLTAALSAKQATLSAPGDVPGLTAVLSAKANQTAVDAKQATLTGTGDVPGLTAALAAKASQAAVDAHTTALAGKQATLTAPGDVPGLQVVLDSKMVDLADVTVSAASGQLAVGVTSNVASGGSYTSPALDATVATPPKRFAVKAAAGGPCTLTFPDSTGTSSAVTLLAGESLILRQKTTSGWGAEAGNKSLASLDARYPAASALTTLAARVPLGCSVGRGLQPVGLRAHAMAPTSAGTSQITMCTRSFHPLTAPDVAAVLPVYQQNFTETNTTYVTATISASVECSDGTLVPFTFAGSLTGSLRPSSVLVPDAPVAFGLQLSPSGAPLPGVWIRTYISVPSGSIFPLNISTGGIVSGEGYNGVNGADQTLAGASTVFTSTGFAFGPSAVYGRTSTRKPNVGLVGDSIISGSSDVNITYGFGDRVCAALGYPAVKISKSGERGTDFGTPAGRRNRAAYLDGLTHALVLYGANDLVNKSITPSALITTMTAIGNYLGNMGIKPYLMTLPPRTSSTDSWATAGNQTATGAASSTTSDPADLATYNAWVRGTPSPYIGYLDIADMAMTARDSGLWKPNLTADGTHPNQAFHTAIASALQTPMSTWTV